MAVRPVGVRNQVAGFRRLRPPDERRRGDEDGERAPRAKPSRAAVCALGKLGSVTTSGIQAGTAVAQRALAADPRGEVNADSGPESTAGPTTRPQGPRGHVARGDPPRPPPTSPGSRRSPAERGNGIVEPGRPRQGERRPVLDCRRPLRPPTLVSTRRNRRRVPPAQRVKSTCWPARTGQPHHCGPTGSRCWASQFTQPTTEGIRIAAGSSHAVMTRRHQALTKHHPPWGGAWDADAQEAMPSRCQRIG